MSKFADAVAAVAGRCRENCPRMDHSFQSDMVRSAAERISDRCDDAVLCRNAPPEAVIRPPTTHFEKFGPWIAAL